MITRAHTANVFAASHLRFAGNRTAGVLPGLFKAVLVMQYSPIDQFEVHHCVTNTHTLTFRPNRFVIAYIIFRQSPTSVSSSVEYTKVWSGRARAPP